MPLSIYHGPNDIQAQYKSAYVSLNYNIGHKKKYEFQHLVRNNIYYLVGITSW